MNQRRINSLAIFVFLALLLAGTLLLLPSQRQRREDHLRAEIGVNATLGTEADMARLKGASEFVIPSRKPKKGDLYVFIPTLNNHVAFVASPKTNSFLQNDFPDVEVHVFPVTEPESPGTNMAIKLALSAGGAEGQSFVDEVGQHPLTAAKKLTPIWDKVPASKKETIEGQIRSNEALLSKLGKYKVFLRYQKFIVKGESWTDLRNPIFLLRDFYDGR